MQYEVLKISILKISFDENKQTAIWLLKNGRIVAYSSGWKQLFRGISVNFCSFRIKLPLWGKWSDFVTAAQRKQIAENLRSNGSYILSSFQQQKPQFHWQTMVKADGEVQDNPKITKPIPQGLQIIGAYLTRRRQRILDLFARADKDKNWQISRDEFKNCIHEVMYYYYFTELWLLGTIKVGIPSQGQHKGTLISIHSIL